jgi:hypothetical protein
MNKTNQRRPDKAVDNVIDMLKMKVEENQSIFCDADMDFDQKVKIGQLVNSGYLQPKRSKIVRHHQGDFEYVVYRINPRIMEL